MKAVAKHPGLLFSLLLTLLIASACDNLGGPGAAPSSRSDPASLPLGRTGTTIRSWTDPRPSDWSTKYPLFAPVTMGDGSLKRVQEIGNITLCGQVGMRPILYVDPSSRYIVGAEPEMMAEVATRLGIKTFSYHRVTFAARVPQLIARECDAFVSGIAIFTDRARWPNVKFTAPYRLNQRVVVVAAGSSYRSTDDLRGKSIGAVAGSETLLYAQQLAERLGGGTTVRQFPDESSVRAAAGDATVAAYVDSAYNVQSADRQQTIRALPDLIHFAPTGALADDLKESPYHYGALAALTRTEDGDLNLALSVAFAEIIADGTMKRLLMKWGADSSAVFDLVRPDAR